MATWNVTNPYLWIAGLVLLVIVTWEVMRSKFVNRLRDNAHDVWVGLGQPRGWLGRLFVFDGFELEKFILKRRYRSLSGDLVKAGDALNTVLKVLIAVFALALVAIFGPNLSHS